MPRYFFDLVENGHVFRDTDGLLLDGPEEARSEAEKSLPPIVRDLAPPEDGFDSALGDSDPDFAIDVRDEDGRYVMRVTAEGDGPLSDPSARID